MKRKNLLFVLVLCISVLGTGRPSRAASAKWTFMVYMAANNNIEEDSMIPLLEMGAIGSTDQVNIVVQLTRPATYTGFYGEWGGTRRFLITKSNSDLSAGDFQISPSRYEAYLQAQGTDQATIDQFDQESRPDQEQEVLQDTVPTLDPAVPLTPLQVKSVQDLGTNVNSGSGAALADFGKWAVQNYPAEHYALAVWDHGGGWSMIASDDTLAPDGIPMPDLAHALGSITQTAGNDKLDLIDLDGCLMGQLPVAVTVAPFGKYLLASEELIPGYSMNYIDMLRTITANPASSAVDAGKAAVDAYAKMYSSLGADVTKSYDLGLTDLAKVGGVVSAVNAFDDAVQASPEDEIKAIGTARHNALEFASVGESHDMADQFSSVDLDDFMKLMSGLTSDAAVKKAAQGVIDAEAGAVIYHKASDSLKNATGMSVFFPRNEAVFQDSEGDRYTDEFGTSLAGWQNFLDTFYGVAKKQIADNSSTAPLSLEITAVKPGTDTPVSTDDKPVISFDVNGTAIVDITAYVMLNVDAKTSIVLDEFPIQSAQDVGGRTITAYKDGVSTQSLTWDVSIPTITDGKTTIPVLMTQNDDDNTQGYIDGIYTDKSSGQTTNAFLDVDLNSMKVIGVWTDQTGDVDTVAEIQAAPGDTFEPLSESIDANGNATDAPSGKILHFSDTDLAVAYAPAPAGDYTVELDVNDAAGNNAYDSTSLTVANP